MTDAGARGFRLAQVKRYAILAYGALGTMADIGLMVAGALLVGLSVAVLLAGVGIASVETDLATGAMLVSALVLGVTGGFFLGLAAEGPLGRGRRLVGFKHWEVGIGRTLAVFMVGLVGLLLNGFLAGLVVELPPPLIQGAAGIRAVAVAGMVAMPLIGIPLSLLLRYAPYEKEWLMKADVPSLYVVWAVAALIIMS